MLTSTSKHFALQYLREETLPSTFCSGCGAGEVTNSFIKAVKDLGYEDLSKFTFVSGIGCSSWITSPYFKADTLHTTHGRAIAFATGLKLANPELKIVVISGDGDLAAIGGNHLIHAARRNIDMTVICVNNYIYGMTGGQVGPTTFTGDRTSTTPYGNPERPFDISRLVAAAGANYVARWTTAHPVQAARAIRTALEKKGFSFVEIISQCPTSYGRKTGTSSPEDMIVWFKKYPIRKKDAPVDLQIPTRDGVDLGVFADRNEIEFIESMRAIYANLEE
ncbi:MAG: thiamine pyrophosphate-dependent enzyme [Candidatus Thorarchaeota archaeon]